MLSLVLSYQQTPPPLVVGPESAIDTSIKEALVAFAKGNEYFETFAFFFLEQRNGGAILNQHSSWWFEAIVFAADVCFTCGLVAMLFYATHGVVRPKGQLGGGVVQMIGSPPSSPPPTPAMDEVRRAKEEAERLLQVMEERVAVALAARDAAVAERDAIRLEASLETKALTATVDELRYGPPEQRGVVEGEEQLMPSVVRAAIADASKVASDGRAAAAEAAVRIAAAESALATTQERERALAKEAASAAEASRRAESDLAELKTELDGALAALAVAHEQAERRAAKAEAAAAEAEAAAAAAAEAAPSTPPKGVGRAMLDEVRRWLEREELGAPPTSPAPTPPSEAAKRHGIATNARERARQGASMRRLALLREAGSPVKSGTMKELRATSSSPHLMPQLASAAVSPPSRALSTASRSSSAVGTPSGVFERIGHRLKRMARLSTSRRQLEV